MKNTWTETFKQELHSLMQLDPTFKLDSTLVLFFLGRSGTLDLAFSPLRKMRERHLASKMAQAKAVEASASMVPRTVQESFCNSFTRSSSDMKPGRTMILPTLELKRSSVGFSLGKSWHLRCVGLAKSIKLKTFPWSLEWNQTNYSLDLNVVWMRDRNKRMEKTQERIHYTC